MDTDVEKHTLRPVSFNGWLKVAKWSDSDGIQPSISTLRITMECAGFHRAISGANGDQVNRENIRALLIQAADELSKHICEQNGIE